MALPTRILEAALYCDDLTVTTAFYQDLFKFAPLVSNPRIVALDAGQGTVLLLFQRGESMKTLPTAGGTIPPHDGSGPSHLALAIRSEDLADWERRLTKAAVAVESRVQWDGGGTSLYFRDPDNHSIELATPGVWATY